MEHLEPAAIAKAVESRGEKPAKAPSAAEVQKEERLRMREERLNKKAEPPPPPPPPVDKSPLLDKLHAYKERFPQLQSRNKISAKSTVDELQDELHYIETQLSGGNQGGGMQIFLAAVNGIEQLHRVYNPLELNLDGLGRVASDNAAQFADIVDELVIKYGTGVKVGPEMRLAVALGTLVYTVHAGNTNGTLAKAMAQMRKK